MSQQTRLVNSMHRIRSGPGPRAVQPDPQRGDRRFDGAGHLDTWNNDHAWQKTRELAEH